MHVNDFSVKPHLYTTPNILFSNRDLVGILSREYDPMSINVQMFNWNIKRVLIDSNSYVDIFYYEDFEKL